MNWVCIVKIVCVYSSLDQTQTQGRGRIIFSTERGFHFLGILNDFISEYEQLPEASEVTESERLKT